MVRKTVICTSREAATTQCDSYNFLIWDQPRPLNKNNQEIARERGSEPPYFPQTAMSSELYSRMLTSTSTIPQHLYRTCYPYMSCRSALSKVASAVDNSRTLVVRIHLELFRRSLGAWPLELIVGATPSRTFKLQISSATARRSIWPRYSHMTLSNFPICQLAPRLRAHQKCLVPKEM